MVTSGPNNDGFDIESSTDVLIEECLFETGDDCVVLKSGMNEDGWRVNKPTENIIVRNIFTKIGHGGVVFGSDVSGGIRNVYVQDISIKNITLTVDQKHLLNYQVKNPIMLHWIMPTCHLLSRK